MKHEAKPGSTVFAARRARGDRGVALVEFAILAPLLFALIVGIFSGGLAMSRKNSMTSAVREGARFGATLNEDAANWATTVRQRVLDLAPTDLVTNQVCVQLWKKGDGSPRKEVLGSRCSGRTPPSLSTVPTGQCAVLVWAYDQRDLQAVFFTRSLHLDAGALSRYERSGSPATCG